MDIESVREIIDCLPAERTLFHYFRDRQAVYMLQWLLRQRGQQTLPRLRASRWNRLLSKPVLKPVLAHCGDGVLAADDLDCVWPAEAEAYRLTLGQWGETSGYGWQQTSRPGFNLVLQLNFNRYHDTEFQNWTGIDTSQSFNYHGHPVSARCPNTLAWSRLDVDLDQGEVLIEEIQTDWIRRVKRTLWRLQRIAENGSDAVAGRGGLNVRGMHSYYEHILRRHEKNWSEAMLLSTIWFCHQELGIDRIWYHSYDTGVALKNMRDYLPPRSLYTDLPRRFCFTTTGQGPSFICDSRPARKRLKKVVQPSWYRLEAYC